MFLDREQAIEKLNLLGHNKTPFFFFTDFLGSKCWISEDEKEILWQINSNRNYSYIELKSKAVQMEKYPKSKDRFEPQFRKVVDNIRFGNSFLTNLTMKTPINVNLSLEEIFHFSKARYKVLKKDHFVVFSPETFIEIKDNLIYSHPMKGTIDAAIDNAKEKILTDPKETAEHITIVDLIRNDLSQFAKKVEVTRFRYVQEIKTHAKNLLQVSSEIKGELDTNWHSSLGDITFSLLPAGSISGAPKPSTVAIIEDVEDYERGFYTGICGYFDGKNLDTGVMIRFIEKEGEKLYFKSGGGITSFSNLDAEYQEVIDKIYVPIH